MRENGRTEEVVAVLGLPELSLQCFEALIARLEEAHAFHMRHPVALLVVDLVREVDLVGQESGLRRGQGHDWCLRQHLRSLHVA